MEINNGTKTELMSLTTKIFIKPEQYQIVDKAVDIVQITFDPD